MKKVNIICVGKIKEQYLKDGIEEYSKRLSRFCEFKICELADFGDTAGAVEKESESILKKTDGFSILLDINGQTVSSVELSKIIDKAYTNGADNINFIIGGSEGVDSKVKAAASVSVSFGKVTYPHQLMRLILAEQIYRAFNILGNTPYHK